VSGVKGKPRKRGRGFYRRALERDEERGYGQVDVAEIRRRLIEEMRRRPGEVHLLLQGSKVLLRAEALERRGPRRGEKDLAESVEAVLRQFEAEIGAGSGQEP